MLCTCISMYMFLGVPLPGATHQSSMPPAITSASAVGKSLQPTCTCTYMCIHLVYIYLFHFVVLFIFTIEYPLADQSPAITHSTCSLSSKEELNRIPRGDIAADVIITAFMQRNNNTLDINNVGRLGVLLARYTFFGDDIHKKPGLDRTVIDLLMSTIHTRHPFSLMSATEFRTKIRPKVERALTDFLKPTPPSPFPFHICMHSLAHTRTYMCMHTQCNTHT